MTNQIHIAAQYLVAAGISFLDQKGDDSHMNLKFSLEDNNLHSCSLNQNGDNLSFNYLEFALQWNSSGSIERIYLDGASHYKIIRWIQKTLKKYGIEKAYIYEFPYELSNTIKDNFVFTLSNKLYLYKALSYRRLIQDVLEVFIQENNLVSTIKVCPHHLNTGIHTSLRSESDLNISFGLALPDTNWCDYYFYIRGYDEHTTVDTSHFPQLNFGEWYSTGFDGAILPAKGATVITAYQFFESALAAYIE